jgi:hypothetical protein
LDRQDYLFDYFRTSAFPPRCPRLQTHQRSHSQSMVGALNKLPVAASGILFFGDPATFANVASILVGFFAGLVVRSPSLLSLACPPSGARPDLRPCKQYSAAKSAQSAAAKNRAFSPSSLPPFVPIPHSPEPSLHASRSASRRRSDPSSPSRSSTRRKWQCRTRKALIVASFSPFPSSIHENRDSYLLLPLLHTFLYLRCT